MASGVGDDLLYAAKQHLATVGVIDRQCLRQVDIYRGTVAVLRCKRANRLREVDVTRVAQTADHVAYVAEQQARNGVRLANMVGRLSFREPGRDIELKTERRQVMAEGVVQVA